MTGMNADLKRTPAGPEIRKIIRKWLIVFLAAIMSIATGSSHAFAQDRPFTMSGEWIYTENDTGITLVKYGGSDTDLKIPESIDGKYVTQLDASLFSGDRTLERIVIPSTVTVIGANAFNGCCALREVTLSFSLKSIPAGLFRDCVSLEQIEFPASVKSIGNFAFYGCEKLDTLMIPNITSVGESAFENCTGLKKIYYTDKLRNVGGFAFRNTPWLESQTDDFVYIGKKILVKWNGTGREVNIPYNTVMISSVFTDNEEIETVILPETVRNIGQYAFRGAINLKTINFPQYLTTIGPGAFDGCRSLQEVILPGTMTSIGASAFHGCEKLKQLIIPPKVTNIQNMVLADCPSLTDVVIPEGVTNLHAHAFQGSPKARVQLSCGSEAEALAIQNEIPYSCYVRKEGNFIYQRSGDGIRILKYTGKQTEVEVPAEIEGLPVTEIGPGAFQDNDAVHKIVLPATAENISEWAFTAMDHLESIVKNPGVIPVDIPEIEALPIIEIDLY